MTITDAEGFVSDKYLTDEPVAKAASVAQAQAGAKTNSSTSTGDPVTDAAIAKYGPNIMIFDDGTIFSTETWEQVGNVDGSPVPSTPAKDIPANGFDKGMAQQIWAYVNEERTAAGLNALEWSDDIYNFACQRAQQIITDYSHSGRGDYGENIYAPCPADWTAYDIHMGWHNSQGHYDNYMKSAFTTGACAVYMYNGYYYAVENFSRTSSPQTDYTAQQTREVNGETVDLYGAQAEAVDNGNTWTASNGIIVYVESNGNLSCNATGDAATAALLEYIDTH